MSHRRRNYIYGPPPPRRPIPARFPPDSRPIGAPSPPPSRPNPGPTRRPISHLGPFRAAAREKTRPASRPESPDPPAETIGG